MANLSYLKIYINPAKKTVNNEQVDNTALTSAQITTYGTPNGYMAFDEVTNLLYVNGKSYGLSAANATALSNAISAIATLNGTESEAGSVAYIVKTAINTAITNNLGSLSQSLVTGATGSTVEALITGLQSQISGLGDSYVSRSTGSGNHDYADTNAIYNAIQAVISDGNDDKADDTVKGAKLYAADQASSAQTNAISTIKGTGATSVSSSTSVLNPNDGDNNIWLSGEEQTLSHLKQLINVITGGSKVDLASIQTTIAAITQEIQDGNGGETLTGTIIDAYKTLRGTGDLVVGGDDSNNHSGGTTVTTLQGLIEALEDYAEGLASTATTQVSKTGSYINVTNVGGTGAANYQIATTSDLDSAISGAKTSITEVTGTAGTNNYIMVTKTAGQNGTGDSYAIKTTDALETAISSAASSAAGQVISWEVLS